MSVILAQVRLFSLNLKYTLKTIKNNPKMLALSKRMFKQSLIDNYLCIQTSYLYFENNYGVAFWLSIFYSEVKD